MKTLSPALLIASLLAISNVANGDVYKHIDEDGNVTFGEVAVAGAKKVVIPKANIAQANSFSSSSNSLKSANIEQSDLASNLVAVAYESLTVESPAQDQVIHGLSESALVKLLPEPGLGPNDQLIISINGEDVSDGSNTSHALEQLPRGSYSVSGRILNADGEVKIRSEEITFHVQRPSILIGNP